MSEDNTSAAAQLLAAALDYHRRNWSIIPMAMAAKRPARKWKAYQRRRASEAQLRKWFGNGDGYGIGVVFGDVSGGLVSRDFDALDAYQRWADNYADLAATLPTVATNRGRHVYCIAAAGSVDALRAALGKPGSGAIGMRDGELRAGVGCYSVLPPSVHPSGHVYRWIISLPPLGESLPIVDVRDFVPSEKRALPHNNTYFLTESDSPTTTQSHVYVSDSLVEAAIEATLPKRVGERHDRIFAFVRRLRAIPELASATAAELGPHVCRWHARALPIIATKAWDESWLDFLGAWHGVEHPAGREPLASVLARADAAETPDVALALEQPALRRLIGLCRELQRIAGDEPFPLACRAPAALLGIDHDTVAEWLKALCRAGVLRRERTGDFIRHRAAEYRYLPPL